MAPSGSFYSSSFALDISPQTNLSKVWDIVEISLKLQKKHVWVAEDFSKCLHLLFISFLHFTFLEETVEHETSVRSDFIRLCLFPLVFVFIFKLNRSDSVHLYVVCEILE